MTAENDRLERYIDERMREYEERVRLRELKSAAREAGHRCVAAKRARESEERTRLRELKKQPCGAKTRAGHPCQRKGLGRGGRCANHGGASTGPKTIEGRQRIAEAQRRRWAACAMAAADPDLTHAMAAVDTIRATGCLGPGVRQPWTLISVEPRDPNVRVGVKSSCLDRVQKESALMSIADQNSYLRRAGPFAPGWNESSSLFCKSNKDGPEILWRSQWYFEPQPGDVIAAGQI
jgi:hypothetical protein